MDLRTAKRLALIVMALFPALWGLLGFLNDATDFTNTVNGSVRPMIAMTDTFNNPWQTWRAMTAPWAAPAGLIVIMSTEGIAGILASIGVLAMLANFRASAEAFAKGKAWMILGCLAAILVWGIGFMVIAGDWFLSWERSKDPLNSQAGAMIYFLPCALALIVAMVHREEP
jgi:predicted small integral membrane protein